MMKLIVPACARYGRECGVADYVMEYFFLICFSLLAVVFTAVVIGLCIMAIAYMLGWRPKR